MKWICAQCEQDGPLKISGEAINFLDLCREISLIHRRISGYCRNEKIIFDTEREIGDDNLENRPKPFPNSGRDRRN